jgi:ribonuclease HII
MKGIIEAGIDEAGRGPMFGRVYAAAVVLPNEDEGSGFNFSLMKDSKKFSSKKKIKEAYDHIKQYAKAYSVQFAEHEEIDSMNIRNATFKAMHAAVKALGIQPDHLLVDGNDFKPYIYMGEDDDEYVSIANTCVEGGDNTYCSIAAASILAKVERDKYVEEMCDKYPKLDEYYGLRSNKGYGCKRHMDGIKEHGISRWHRRSFGICKTFDECNDADSVVVAKEDSPAVAKEDSPAVAKEDSPAVAKEDSPAVAMATEKPQHICEICGKSYVRKGSLTTHMKSKHADS